MHDMSFFSQRGKVEMWTLVSFEVCYNLVFEKFQMSKLRQRTNKPMSSTLQGMPKAVRGDETEQKKRMA